MGNCCASLPVTSSEHASNALYPRHVLLYNESSRVTPAASSRAPREIVGDSALNPAWAASTGVAPPAPLEETERLVRRSTSLVVEDIDTFEVSSSTTSFDQQSYSLSVDVSLPTQSFLVDRAHPHAQTLSDGTSEMDFTHPMERSVILERRGTLFSVRDRERQVMSMETEDRTRLVMLMQVSRRVLQAHVCKELIMHQRAAELHVFFIERLALTLRITARMEAVERQQLMEAEMLTVAHLWNHAVGYAPQSPKSLAEGSPFARVTEALSSSDTFEDRRLSTPSSVSVVIDVPAERPSSAPALSARRILPDMVGVEAPTLYRRSLDGSEARRMAQAKYVGRVENRSIGRSPRGPVGISDVRHYGQPFGE